MCDIEIIDKNKNKIKCNKPAKLLKIIVVTKKHVSNIMILFYLHQNLIK